MGYVKGSRALDHENQSFGYLRKALTVLKFSNSELNVSSAKISVKTKEGLSLSSPKLSPAKKPHEKILETIQLQKRDR